MNTDLTPTPIHLYDDRDPQGRRLALVYACRVKWDQLQRTENDHVRYCTNCSQPVFQVADVNDYERAVAARRCIMVKPLDGGMFLGASYDDESYSVGAKLQWDD